MMMTNLRRQRNQHAHHTRHRIPQHGLRALPRHATTPSIPEPIHRAVIMLRRIVLHRMHSDIQERARREQQQHPRPPLSALAVERMAAQEMDEEPGGEGADGRREGEDDEVAARGALRESLFEEHGGEPEGGGCLVHHDGEEDDEAQVRGGCGGGAHGDAVGEGVDDEAGCGGEAARLLGGGGEGM